ncbi:Periplasmic binding protein [Sulfurimonas denitrificans DSM 1251]|uniref:Periplasmic binding protein n=1 Tax=Sulfurimonas denitrificans (strain ATCC 33889 / DSM 1251) TaxID=326298 RepID=Q30UD3_SULDN|nr:helical backbone metal receptor [Sulfurimonas denitrificans]ABB43398.1 Periplasmic binding protein [Sulfurimonas denitrificans DSM 1251]MDD3442252.1 helical backbone metal receptor [Sulfurimonas denitrificans]
MNIKLLFLALFFVFTLEANERIISLSPSVTEIIYALKKGDSLVATSEFSLYPPEAKELKLIGGYSNPNLEKIISLCPTLVIGQDFNQATLEKLERFGIKTLMVKLQQINDIKNSILKIAYELHVDSKPIVDEIQSAINSVAKGKESHKVMIVFGLYEDLSRGIYIAGGGIFYDDIIKLCGKTNAYASSDTNQPSLSYENVIALNPDQIIILHSNASNSGVNRQRALSAWHSLPTNASKNRRITVIDESYIHIPSNRVALIIKRICEEINR